MSERSQPNNKAELLAGIRADRAALEAVLAPLTAGQMTRPALESGWSVKDVLAHIVAWEQRMVRWLAEAQRGLVPDVPGTWDDIHRLNEQTYQANRGRPLDELLAEFRDSYPEALAAVEAVPEPDLMQADRYPWREGSPLARLVSANTWWHYREHGEDIRARLGQEQAPPPSSS